MTSPSDVDETPSYTDEFGTVRCRTCNGRPAGGYHLNYCLAGPERPALLQREAEFLAGRRCECGALLDQPSGDCPTYTKWGACS